MNGLTLRRAKISDAGAMAETYCDALAKVGRGIPEPHRAYLQIQREAELQNKITSSKENNSHLIVAEQDGHIIGYVEYAETNPSNVEIVEAYTKENNCRAGKYLMGHTYLFAENKGALIMSVQSIDYSVGFYKKCGFKESYAPNNAQATVYMEMDMKKKNAFTR